MDTITTMDFLAGFITGFGFCAILWIVFHPRPKKRKGYKRRHWSRPPNPPDDQAAKELERIVGLGD